MTSSAVSRLIVDWEFTARKVTSIWKQALISIIRESITHTCKYNKAGEPLSKVS
jgi:hypothetical protein